MNRAAILSTAAQAVTVDRAATHGNLEDNFGTIAAIWSARLGVTITAPQVAILMCDLKTVRAWGNPAHGDNWVDLAGYAACGGELATKGGVHPDWTGVSDCPNCGLSMDHGHDCTAPREATP